MSDRLTNIEIEDVLSSIRRLVSQDVRPTPDPQSPSAAPRLVLTSALRVQAGRDMTTTQATDTAPPAIAPSDTAPSDTAAQLGDLRLQERAVEIEDLLSSQAEDFESDTGEVFAPSGVIGWPDRGHPAPAAAADVEAGIEDEAPFIDADADAIEDAIEAQDTLTAAPEPYVLRHENEDDAAPAMLDEATLREIVRDVLREELQGPMGTRVTRNLRRLVRTEIARAFAQDQTP
jgi:hypothetical protein